MRGTFITFEGTEGSGKSTQAARLAGALRRMGVEVSETREPGGTATGEAIRDILQHDRAGEPIGAEAEALLFAACRAQLIFRSVRPALEAGRCVLCDRFFDSTTAYQGYGRGLNLAELEAVHRFVMGDLRPDLTILLDLDVRVGMDRIRARYQEGRLSFDRMESETEAFHRRVREGYLELARRFPERIRVVDAGCDADTVAAEIWGVVRPMFA
jgi:dTMP kinase